MAALLACSVVVGCGSAEDEAGTGELSQALTGGLQATFQKASDWGTGYEGRYTIKNDSSAAVTGWTLEFDMPAGTTVTTHWDAVVTSNGNHYTFRNRSFNGTIAAGNSLPIGFLANGGGAPLNCRINGAPCALALCTAPTWNTFTVYPPGAKAVAQGRQYTAAMWTQGQSPLLNSGPVGSGMAWITGAACRMN